MPDLTNLTPAGVDVPEASLYRAVFIDDAATATDEVRCVVPDESEHLAFDAMRWNPVTHPGVGFFFPKRDDVAVIGIPVNGDPVILEWWPAPGATPDAPLS